MEAQGLHPVWGHPLEPLRVLVATIRIRACHLGLALVGAWVEGSPIVGFLGWVVPRAEGRPPPG